MPQQQTFGDVALFRALVNNSEKTLAQINAVYRPALIAYCYDIVADEHLATEIVLDALQKLWEERNAVSAMQSPVAWLFKCVANKALNALKAKRKIKLLPVNNAIEIADEASIEEEIDAKELKRLITMATTQLPPGQQKIIELSRAGLNRKEIALQCGIAESTVKNQITEAYKNLRLLTKNVFKHYFV